MRGYTNSDGFYIEVSQEHLDVAVAIYEELRKLSASGKVSWKRHHEMMVHEGFNDSDKNENYRQIVKSERKKKGVLPDVEKYVDLLSDDKIEAMRNEAGHIAVATQEMRDEASRWRAIKRTIARDVIIADTIKNGLENVVASATELPKYEPIASGGDTMLVTLNDIHYGYNDPLYYTPKDSEIVINEYADKIIDLGKKEGISKVIVANLGDSIEGVLRNQSLVDSDMSSVDQMIAVSELINGFLEKLSIHFMVDYLALAGNHERLVSNYKDAIDGESYVPINIGLVKKYFEEKDRVTVIETDSIYHHIIKINGRNVFLCHGDRHKVKDNNILYKLSVNYETIIDIVVAGHFHTFSLVEVGERKFLTITGSIKGADRYSEKINAKSGRSQVAIIFNKNDFDIRQVLLD